MGPGSGSVSSVLLTFRVRSHFPWVSHLIVTFSRAIGSARERSFLSLETHFGPRPSLSPRNIDRHDRRHIAITEHDGHPLVGRVDATTARREDEAPAKGELVLIGVPVQTHTADQSRAAEGCRLIRISEIPGKFLR